MDERILNDLDQSNPNHPIFIVPQEEGGDEDDHYFGSIGDATQKHVGSLTSGNRQLWEDLIITKNGMIFRIEASTAWHDPDPLNLRGEDLDKYFKQFTTNIDGTPISDEQLAPIKEAFEVEAEHRALSEDVYDCAELIPYSAMEEFPGLQKYIEIPTTPKDHLVYMGNCNTRFYDEFPEGHPDTNFINAVLNKLNKNSEQITCEFISWLKEWICSFSAEEGVVKILTNLADNILTTNIPATILTKQALLAIDRRWQKKFFSQVQEKASKDAVLSLLRHNEKIWELQAKQGHSVIGSIKAFGQILFSEYKSQMRLHHWCLYRKIKNQYTSRVLVRGIDINRCSMTTLKRLFKSDIQNNSKIAQTVWLGRPYSHIGELRFQGLLTRQIFADDEITDKLLNILENAADKAKEVHTDRPLQLIRTQLIELQRKNVANIHNWSPIWAYYHILKTETNIEIEKYRKTLQDNTIGDQHE